MGSLRILRKHWKLTAVAIFSLAVAMTLSVLSLALSNTFLLLPPAAPEPERLVKIYGQSPAEAVTEISYPDFEYLREHNHVFSDVAADPNSVSINGDSDFEGRVVKAISRGVSDNYFAVLGIRAERGRLLAPGDEGSNPPAAVMTHACWKRLGSDPNIVGKKLFGDVIVGVTPESFTGGFYGLNGDLFVPLRDNTFGANWMTKRDAGHLILLARLKRGATLREARAEVAALGGQLSTAFPKDDKDRSLVVARATLLPPDAIPTAKLVLAILMGFVLLVLLIACANVANLLLAIAVGRRQEAAIKVALGAQRGRLIREFMRESAILCGAGAALGYAAAAAIISRYSTLNLDFGVLGTFSFGLNLHLGAAVIGVTALLMLVAMLATGLAPALYASSPHLSSVLGGEGVVGGTRKAVRRNILVLAQVATCTLVLVGMGLCQRSLYNLRHVDPGFSARRLVAAQVYPETEGQTAAEVKRTYQRLGEQVAGLPGVESVSLASALPLSLGFTHVAVEFPDRREPVKVAQNVIDENYFSTFGIPLLEGRGFNSGDGEKSREVAVINRKMAEMFWPGQDAVGKTFRLGEDAGKTAREATVIGVTVNGKYEEFDEEDQPVIYSALAQHDPFGFSIVARTKGDPQLWIEPIAKTVREAGLVSVFHPLTYEAWSNFPLLLERIAAWVVEGLSALGLLLAVIGLAGAISYSVSERKKELGIRIALGAGPGRLMGMVLRQTVAIAGAGILIGVALGAAATVLVRSQLFGIGTIEWIVLAAVAAGMLVVSLAVAYVAARPWISVHPMEAVRHA